MVKNYLRFINEADAAQPVVQPPAQSDAQPSPQAQPPAQPAQSGTTQTTQGQSQSTNQKNGDLSNYNNDNVTKFPDTVKKMVDLLRDMDKEQLIKIRNLIAELKSINDAKSEIGKL